MTKIAKTNDLTYFSSGYKEYVIRKKNEVSIQQYANELPK